MLGGDDQSKVIDDIRRLECKVELPDEWKDTFFTETGVLPTREEERRRFARRRIRTKALVDIVQSLPAFERTPSRHVVFTCDMSRSGFAFLHTEQLYPLEKIRLSLPQKSFLLEVARCKRYNDQCFMIGAQLLGQPA